MIKKPYKNAELYFPEISLVMMVHCDDLLHLAYSEV